MSVPKFLMTNQNLNLRIQKTVQCPNPKPLSNQQRFKHQRIMSKFKMIMLSQKMRKLMGRIRKKLMIIITMKMLITIRMKVMIKPWMKKMMNNSLGNLKNQFFFVLSFIV